MTRTGSSKFKPSSTNKTLETPGCSNVKPISRTRKALASPYATALQSKHDIIVIDGEDHFGPESKWSARESCFYLAEQWICKNGGLIVVDDSWRYPALRQNTKAKKTVVHESIGPCRLGVTTTDFHYY